MGSAVGVAGSQLMLNSGASSESCRSGCVFWSGSCTQPPLRCVSCGPFLQRVAACLFSLGLERSDSDLTPCSGSTRVRTGEGLEAASCTKERTIQVSAAPGGRARRVAEAAAASEGLEDLAAGIQQMPVSVMPASRLHRVVHVYGRRRARSRQQLYGCCALHLGVGRICV